VGDISRQLRGKLKTMATGAILPTSGNGLEPFPGAPDIAGLIAEGFDPVHSAYLCVQHIASVFAENVSRLPELRDYSGEVASAKDRYMLDDPPIGPLTASYFDSWALFDLLIGKSTDTLAGCLIDANDIIWMNPDQLEALKKMSNSRMGIYEHQGLVENFVRLRELITNQEFVIHVPSGYLGRFGELWYVRLLPPLLPDLATYHIAFTTPYVLSGASRVDWLQFLRRNVVLMEASSDAEALYRFMKSGANKNYWNEFIYFAFDHARSTVSLLSGIPDLKSTLPRSRG
jgi:hypothetical protein